MAGEGLYILLAFTKCSGRLDCGNLIGFLPISPLKFRVTKCVLLFSSSFSDLKREALGILWEGDLSLL